MWNDRYGIAGVWGGGCAGRGRESGVRDGVKVQVCDGGICRGAKN